MYQYKDYCYASQTELFTAFASDPIFISAIETTSFGNLGGGQVSLSRGADGSVYSAPSCSFVGPSTSNFGLTIGDAVELGWSCFFVLISAYCIMLIRKAL
jgi:hypothetical protein